MNGRLVIMVSNRPATARDFERHGDRLLWPMRPDRGQARGHRHSGGAGSTIYANTELRSIGYGVKL